MNRITVKEFLTERSKHKVFIIILCLYVLLCLCSAIHWCFNFDLRNLLLCLAFILIAPLILIAEYFIKFRCGVLFTIGVLFIAYGSILGSCFDVYSKVPIFDTILHGTSGILFTGLGFMLGEKFFHKAESKKDFWGLLLFGIFFSFFIAVVWEFFEYGCNALLGFDMMEDSIIRDINSYYLSGSHNVAVILNDITQTVIEYGNGQTYVINGYLDIGLIDTMHDMLICAAGSIIFTVLAIIGQFKIPKLNKALIPQII